MKIWRQNKSVITDSKTVCRSEVCPCDWGIWGWRWRHIVHSFYEHNLVMLYNIAPKYDHTIYHWIPDNSITLTNINWMRTQIQSLIAYNPTGPNYVRVATFDNSQYSPKSMDIWWTKSGESVTSEGLDRFLRAVGIGGDDGTGKYKWSNLASNGTIQYRLSMITGDKLADPTILTNGDIAFIELESALKFLSDCCPAYGSQIYFYTLEDYTQEYRGGSMYTWEDTLADYDQAEWYDDTYWGGTYTLKLYNQGNPEWGIPDEYAYVRTRWLNAKARAVISSAYTIFNPIVKMYYRPGRPTLGTVNEFFDFIRGFTENIWDLCKTIVKSEVTASLPVQTTPPGTVNVDENMGDVYTPDDRSAPTVVGSTDVGLFSLGGWSAPIVEVNSVCDVALGKGAVMNWPSCPLCRGFSFTSPTLYGSITYAGYNSYSATFLVYTSYSVWGEPIQGRHDISFIVKSRTPHNAVVIDTITPFKTSTRLESVLSPSVPISIADGQEVEFTGSYQWQKTTPNATSAPGSYNMEIGARMYIEDTIWGVMYDSNKNIQFVDAYAVMTFYHKIESPIYSVLPLEVSVVAPPDPADVSIVITSDNKAKLAGTVSMSGDFFTIVSGDGAFSYDFDDTVLTHEVVIRFNPGLTGAHNGYVRFTTTYGGTKTVNVYVNKP